MDLIKGPERWRDEHQNSIVLGGLRIILGILIFVQGVYFAHNIEEIQGMISLSRNQLGSIALAHYIVMAHIAGGFMIAIGFLTRVAILFQLPILIGAVIFANTARGVFTMYSEAIFAVIVLALLLFYLFFGPGYYSVG